MFKSQGFKTLPLCLGVILAISLVNYLVLAWTEPSQTPPGGNVNAPINVGNTGQSKSGGLILNTGGAAIGLIVDKGYVGIGTNSPAKKLEVKGDVLATDVCNAAGACLSMLNDFIGSQPLAGNLHTRAQCKNEGGEVVDIGLAFPICRFTAAICPVPPNSKYGTWYQFDNWSVTAANICCGNCWGGYYSHPECGAPHLACGACDRQINQYEPTRCGCTTGYHTTWSSVVRESCSYDTYQYRGDWGMWMCYTVSGCNANVVQIGCK